VRKFDNNPPYHENGATYEVIYYYSHIGSHIGLRDFYWYGLVTFIDHERRNMAAILRYFTEFGTFDGQLRHNG